MSGTDAIAEWAAAQQRVIELVSSAPAARLAGRVPACPGWSATELLAHMIGLDADVLAGDEPDDHNPAWTQRQVDQRAGREAAALVAEWRELTGPMEAWMSEHGTRPLGDVIIHEQDLRGALGQPGARDSGGLALVRDSMGQRFGGRVSEAALAPVSLEGPGWRLATGDGTTGLRLAAPDFDLARALMSRRTEDQLRSWVAGGDISPYLPLFAGLGPLPDEALPE